MRIFAIFMSKNLLLYLRLGKNCIKGGPSPEVTLDDFSNTRPHPLKVPDFFVSDLKIEI